MHVLHIDVALTAHIPPLPPPHTHTNSPPTHTAFHHRDPGIVGLIADSACTSWGECDDRVLYYGVIVDGFHTHPTALRMAHATHPAGCVVVTDAMAGMGLPPGEHSLAQHRVQIDDDGR
jgi:N-acetylglucosamine-6-phosphate deacetylase